MTNRVAGIDIGSNSFRLIIADIAGETITPLHKDLVTVRLGKDLGQTGRIVEKSIFFALDVLRKFKNVMDRFGVVSCRACGTHALRSAANANDFIVPASEILKTEIKILSGDEEALLSYRGAQAFLPQNYGFNKEVIFIDVGGGSTEFVFSHSHNNDKVLSLNLGAVSLTESCLSDAIPSTDEIKQLSDEINKGLVPFINMLSKIDNEVCLIASGGTATALAHIALGLTEYDANAVQNHFLGNDKLGDLFAYLQSLSSNQRNKIPGLEDKRGEIILAGAKILRSITDLCRAPGIMVSDAGLLEGIVLSNIH